MPLNMRIYNLLLTFFVLAALEACDSTPKEISTENTETVQVAQNETVAKYDSILAMKYGADEYGMKQYVMAFLKKGPNRDLSEEESAELQRAHLENITRMAEEGSLLLAGPFMDDGDIRGIYIFDVKTTEEAKALTETDPAIKAGSLIMELHPWYGSAAVMAIPDVHEKVARKGI